MRHIALIRAVSILLANTLILAAPGSHAWAKTAAGLKHSGQAVEFGFRGTAPQPLPASVSLTRKLSLLSPAQRLTLAASETPAAPASIVLNQNTFAQTSDNASVTLTGALGATIEERAHTIALPQPAAELPIQMADTQAQPGAPQSQTVFADLETVAEAAQEPVSGSGPAPSAGFRRFFDQSVAAGALVLATPVLAQAGENTPALLADLGSGGLGLVAGLAIGAGAVGLGWFLHSRRTRAESDNYYGQYSNAADHYHRLRRAHETETVNRIFSPLDPLQVLQDHYSGGGREDGVTVLFKNEQQAVRALVEGRLPDELERFLPLSGHHRRLSTDELKGTFRVAYPQLWELDTRRGPKAPFWSWNYAAIRPEFDQTRLFDGLMDQAHARRLSFELETIRRNDSLRHRFTFTNPTTGQSLTLTLLPEQVGEALRTLRFYEGMWQLAFGSFVELAKDTPYQKPIATLEEKTRPDFYIPDFFLQWWHAQFDGGLEQLRVETPESFSVDGRFGGLEFADTDADIGAYPSGLQLILGDGEILSLSLDSAFKGSIVIASKDGLQGPMDITPPMAKELRRFTATLHDWLFHRSGLGDQTLSPGQLSGLRKFHVAMSGFKGDNDGAAQRAFQAALRRSATVVGGLIGLAAIFLPSVAFAGDGGIGSALPASFHPFLAPLAVAAIAWSAYIATNFYKFGKLQALRDAIGSLGLAGVASLLTFGGLWLAGFGWDAQIAAAQTALDLPFAWLPALIAGIFGAVPLFKNRAAVAAAAALLAGYWGWWGLIPLGLVLVPGKKTVLDGVASEDEKRRIVIHSLRINIPKAIISIGLVIAASAYFVGAQPELAFQWIAAAITALVLTQFISLNIDDALLLTLLAGYWGWIGIAPAIFLSLNAHSKRPRFAIPIGVSGDGDPNGTPAESG